MVRTQRPSALMATARSTGRGLGKNAAAGENRLLGSVTSTILAPPRLLGNVSVRSRFSGRLALAVPRQSRGNVLILTTSGGG